MKIGPNMINMGKAPTVGAITVTVPDSDRDDDRRDSSVLKEPNLSVTSRPGEGDGLRLPPGAYEEISEMIDKHFEALHEIVENLGVSKEERENAARRQKELKEERRKLDDIKKDLDRQILFVKSLLVDAAAERQFWENRANEMA